MNLRELEYLAAIDEFKHFRKAAEKCFVSQPTLSGQLKKLEIELGVQLVERTTRQVFLTPIGKEIVKNLKARITELSETKYSDIDVHLIVDYSAIDENEKLVKDFFRNATIVWNKVHNIMVKGHPVELYVQSHAEPHHSTGVYSIKYDRWNKTPSKYSPEIDYANVKKKYAKS